MYSVFYTSDIRFYCDAFYSMNGIPCIIIQILYLGIPSSTGINFIINIWHCRILLRCCIQPDDIPIIAEHSGIDLILCLSEYDGGNLSMTGTANRRFISTWIRWIFIGCSIRYFLTDCIFVICKRSIGWHTANQCFYNGIRTSVCIPSVRIVFIIHEGTFNQDCRGMSVVQNI